jgi:hypothetical protein
VSQSVKYGSGSFSGDEYTDTVTLSPDLVISKQSIGVATQSQGFQGVDGILGIGPVDLTANTLSSGKSVPTVTDNLLSSGTISTEIIGIYYVPAAESSTVGSMDFGATLVLEMCSSTLSTHCCSIVTLLNLPAILHMYLSRAPALRTSTGVSINLSLTVAKQS